MTRQLLSLIASLAVVAGCGPSPSASPAASPSPSTTGSPDASTSPSASPAEPSSAPPSPSTSASASPAGPSTARWSRIDVRGTAPSAREDHTWTLDTAGTTAYLFGGRDGSQVHGDLYAFDVAKAGWRRLRPGGPRPAARFGHEAAWVDGLGLVVFAGQADATTFFGDLWAFDPARERWRQLPARGARPVPRYGTCSAVGPDGRLWISHGFTEDGTRFFDTRAYDFATGRWSDETPAGRRPVARCLHGCFVAEDGRFVLYAGQTTGVPALGDLWALRDPGTGSASWTSVEGRLPRERNLYAYARLDDAWLVVGGRGGGGRALGDIHLIDAASLAVTEVRGSGQRPAARAGATLIPTASGALMFGGTDGDVAFRDLWQLELPATPG